MTLTLSPRSTLLAAGLMFTLCPAAHASTTQGTAPLLRDTQSAIDVQTALIAKADRSFSELVFGMTREAAADLQLREIIEQDCDVNGQCDWLIASAPHVRHAFDENGTVDRKTIIIDDYGNGAVRALGIGNARLKEAVVDAVAAYLPGIAFTCRSVEEAGEGEGRSSCGATLGGANIKLIFADSDVLAEVHLYRDTGI